MAQELNYDQAIDSLRKMPEDKQRLVLGKLTPDARKSILTKLTGTTQDFTANPKGEGLYRVVQNGQEIKVPFSRVQDAIQAGYTIHPDEMQRYTKDLAATKPDWRDKYTQISPHKPLTYGASPKDIAKEGARAFANVGAGGLGVILHPVDTVVGIGKMLFDPFIGNPQAHALAEQFRKQPVETAEQFVGQTAVLDAAGHAIPKVPGAVAHPLETVKAAASKLMRPTVEALTETTPREVRRLAEETQKTNTAASQAHKDVVQPHAEELVGKEIEHHLDERTANEKEAAKHKAEQEKVIAKNQETREKHRKESEDVKAHNDRVTSKHEETARKIQEERDAAEHALELRRAEESKLEQDTNAYYAKNDATKAKVKTAADAKWKPVHQALDAETIDGGTIEKPLAKILEISPDVRREIAQLIPDPEDVSPDSSYAKARAQIIKETTGSIEPDAYDKLDDFNKKQVDRWTEERGFTPDPIDLNPQSGVDIPFDKIHRAQSIIGRNIRQGRYGYDGPLLGEMTKLQQTLYSAENQIASTHGKTADLNAARQATREYHEAFGIEKNKPLSNEEKSELEANPEQFKERQEQKRVDAAAKHDPTLATDYEKVKSQREKVKKQMKTEEQLRASLRQVPDVPTVGDLREGYNLKEPPAEPVYTKRDANGKLFQLDSKTNAWVPAPETGVKYELGVPIPDRVFTVEDANGSLYKLNNGKWELVPRPRPENLAHPTPESVQLERPVAKDIPDRPIEEEADLTARKQQNVKKQADELHRIGLRRAVYATMTGLSFASIELLTHFNESGIGGKAALAGIAGGAAVLIGSRMLADLIERPDVTAWISKVTPKDAAAWEKLPPEQKELFTNDMKALVEAAKAKHISVSPALAAFAAAGSGKSSQQPLSPEEVKKKAEELQGHFHKSGLAPEPKQDTPPAPPGPQSSNKAYHLVYDPEKDALVPA